MADHYAPTPQVWPEVWVEAPARRVWLHVLLFVLTLLTTTAVGARFHHNFIHGRPAWEVGADLNPFAGLWKRPAQLVDGLSFSLALLLILGVHEMGHLVACDRYGIAASYPYFIPAPTMIGTMGAFIRIKSLFRTRKALFDVGIWGPFAGFIVAVPLLVLGLALSRSATGMYVDGTICFGSPPLLLLLSRFLNPGVSEFDLLLHPIARAAWVGLFATALNLLPAGQLDGGHILYAISPRWHRRISLWIPLILGIPMIALAGCWLLSHWAPVLDAIGDRIEDYYWPGWFIWSVILMLIGRRHPPVYDPSPIDPPRRRQALLALAIFFLCFAPVPFRTF